MPSTIFSGPHLDRQVPSLPHASDGPGPVDSGVGSSVTHSCTHSSNSTHGDRHCSSDLEKPVSPVSPRTINIISDNGNNFKTLHGPGAVKNSTVHTAKPTPCEHELNNASSITDIKQRFSGNPCEHELNNASSITDIKQRISSNPCEHELNNASSVTDIKQLLRGNNVDNDKTRPKLLTNSTVAREPEEHCDVENPASNTSYNSSNSRTVDERMEETKTKQFWPIPHGEEHSTNEHEDEFIASLDLISNDFY